MKIDLWLKEWTGEHQTGNGGPDEEPSALLVDRIDAKGIPVYSSSAPLSDADLWPTSAELVVDGFMYLRLTHAPREFFNLFTPDEYLLGTDPDGALLLNVTSLKTHLQGRDWPYGAPPPLSDAYVVYVAKSPVVTEAESE